MRVVDFLVVGGGIAGLRAAVGLAEAGSVLVVTKEGLAESNTAYAQGGIAVAMGGEEDVALHLADTVAAGDGLVNAAGGGGAGGAGAEARGELMAWGTGFDRYPAGWERRGWQVDARRGRARTACRGYFMRNGDATGREIAVSLLRHLRGLERVELMEWATTVGPVVCSDEDGAGRVVGATLLDAAGGNCIEVRARAVLLASGGAGQFYSDTTNPAVATGDGIAMAYRAGAELMDMEFYAVPSDSVCDGWRATVSDERVAARRGCVAGERAGRAVYAALPCGAGAGAEGRGGAGDWARGDGGGGLSRHARGGEEFDIKARFPGISGFLAGYGLELGRDLIPVRPAAHYLMGGIRTDVHGRSSLPGLYAAGEAACTGVHGANRLASNSLLEGLVFGALAAEAMAGDKVQVRGSRFERRRRRVDRYSGDVDGWIAELRKLMWRDAGLLRDAAGLRRARRDWRRCGRRKPRGLTRQALEARNLLVVAEVIVQAALGREESRGAHSRMDYPERDGVAGTRLCGAANCGLWSKAERRPTHR